MWASLTCALEVEADVFECPHHELQLQQEGEDATVLVQAALSDNNVEGPVNLFRKPYLISTYSFRIHLPYTPMTGHC